MGFGSVATENETFLLGPNLRILWQSQQLLMQIVNRDVELVLS